MTKFFFSDLKIVLTQNQNLKDMEEFLVLRRAFQDKLPDERKSDYMDWKINKNSVKKINSERLKNSRVKSNATVTNLDESDIKLELLEENGLNETESEKDSIESEPIENVVTAKKSEKLKIKKETKPLGPIDEFIANGPRKPEK